MKGMRIGSLVVAGDLHSARAILDDQPLMQIRMVGPGAIELSVPRWPSETQVLRIDDLAAARVEIVQAFDLALSLIQGAIVPTHGSLPDGEVFARAWDIHRRAWIARHAS